jgi:predicted XRE-type DNA-binding protein
MKERLKRVRGSGNVFLDLGFDKAEAENLKLRSELMMRIEDFYRESGLTQAAAAKALGLTQPRLNALLKGKIGLFSLDALVNIANRAGLNVRLVIGRQARLERAGLLRRAKPDAPLKAPRAAVPKAKRSVKQALLDERREGR